jgi:hypothetical protein
LSGIGSVDKVEMVSPTDGWAKGFIQSADKQNGSNGVLHYSNGSWSVVALPAALRAIGRTAQFDFSVTPAGECWLMYQDAVSGDTETLRYEGGSFQVAYTLPHFLGQTITMRSSQDGWLTGTDANGKVAYHFDGSAWAKVAIPTNFKQQPYLYPVVIAPSGEAWLLAGSAADGGLVARYRNGTWEMVQAPSTVDVNTFALVAADEGWATGHAGGTATLYHYQNDSWTQYPN